MEFVKIIKLIENTKKPWSVGEARAQQTLDNKLKAGFCPIIYPISSIPKIALHMRPKAHQPVRPGFVYHSNCLFVYWGASLRKSTNCESQSMGYFWPQQNDWHKWPQNCVVHMKHANLFSTNWTCFAWNFIIPKVRMHFAKSVDRAKHTLILKTQIFNCTLGWITLFAISFLACAKHFPIAFMKHSFNKVNFWTKSWLLFFSRWIA